jgi:hypothetical protein
VGGIGQGLLATGVLSGLHLVAPYGYGATWLIGSYVLVTLAITLGAAYIGPLRKALESAAASGDDAVSNLRTGWAPLAVTYINTHCWAGAIWLMVAKPYA